MFTQKLLKEKSSAITRILSRQFWISFPDADLSTPQHGLPRSHNLGMSLSSSGIGSLSRQLGDGPGLHCIPQHVSAGCQNQEALDDRLGIASPPRLHEGTALDDLRPFAPGHSFPLCLRDSGMLTGPQVHGQTLAKTRQTIPWGVALVVVVVAGYREVLERNWHAFVASQLFLCCRVDQSLPDSAGCPLEDAKFARVASL